MNMEMGRGNVSGPFLCRAGDEL